MSYFDALFALLLVPFALNGWRRGMCREGFDFVGIIGGLIVAAAMAPAVAVVLAHSIPKLLALPIALAGVLVVAMVIARIMGGVLAQALQAIHLGGPDRIVGIVFGGLKGAACIGLVLMLLDQLVPTPAVQLAIQGSFLGPQLMRVATGALEVGRELSSVANGV